jgi:hypothetical protein
MDNSVNWIMLPVRSFVISTVMFDKWASLGSVITPVRPPVSALCEKALDRKRMEINNPLASKRRKYRIPGSSFEELVVY